MSYPEPLERLIENLSRLPGIGKKTAARLAFFLLKAKEEYVEALSESIKDIKKIRICSICFNITESDPCKICLDEGRNKDIIVVVESPSHMLTIESANPGRFRYHILHGLITPIDGIGPNELKIKELRERVEKERIKEVIISTSFTIEGNVTANYIADLLKPISIKVTRIASGIPHGSDIIYADPITLKHSIDNRRII